ncbi:2-polyprenyl-3-methyl-5-hydroxy-6-metoxy-1,4-benzoquinol methylase [Mesonia phycicola]|uniref:2-polyprenyl-3-methyl-5-hydroxy-6-metoxy-1,4-benzoquinol methylase n=1 Tax=Mesonia phycicola TaxID=579105 RepID=A0A1M6D3U6_9FLAO|nr:class I SAM-dependent methyltransferase [Mesonia phycicola]SHI67753.1 2-polyprenyl-3-methyl-5-hydroxy-6-metoxy-1,4-benzoquinol methylase [Mesonia phycicola]
MQNQQLFLTCKDFTVSKEEFQLVWNKEKDILITTPQPSPLELPKYYQTEDYISHTDASKSISDKLYQTVKSVMLKKKVKLINALSKKSTKRLLDIGAGTGDFLLSAKKENWEVEGIEPNDKAKQLAKAKGISLHLTTEELKNKNFEVITMWHVLEHVPDVKKQLQELHSLLSNDGHVVIAVPNFKSFDANYYQEFWAAYDVPKHLWHFSQKGIKRLFKENQFKLVKTKPLYFDSFYVSLLSEKNKTGKSNLIKAFFLGLKSNLKARSSTEYSSLIYIFKKE